MAEKPPEPRVVEFPDGSVITFPHGTSDATIEAEYTRRQAQPPPQRSLARDVGTGIARSLLKGPFLQAEPEFLAPAGGMAGALAGGGILGASIGGAGGEAAAQLERRLLSLVDPTQVPPESSMEALQGITEQGALQGGIEAFGLGLGQAARPLVPRLEPAIQAAIKVAERAGIRLTPGQATQGPLASIENVLKKMLGTGGIFRRSELEQNAALNKFINQEVEKISAVSDRATAGRMLGQSVRKAEQAAGETIGRAEDAIIAGTGDAPIQFSPESRKAISAALESIEGLEAAAPGASKAATEIRSKLFNDKITYSDAILEGRRLRILADSFSNRTISGLTGKVRGELLDTISGNLEKRGLTGEAEAFRAARQRYAEIEEALTVSYIKKIARTKQGQETLGAELANPSSGITKATSIKTILGEVPAPTRRAFVEEILKRTRAEGEVITGGALESQVANLGEDTIRAVLKKDEADFLLKDITPLANLLDIPRSTVKPASSQAVPLLAQGGVAAIAASATGSTAIGATILVSPIILSKLVTSVEGRNVLRALSKAKQGTQLYSSLLGRSLSVAYNEAKQEEKRSLAKEGPQKP